MPSQLRLQSTGPVTGKAAGATKAAKPAWPGTLAEQAQALRAALAARGAPAAADELANMFARAPIKQVRELLDVLAALGQVRQLDDQRFAA